MPPKTYSLISVRRLTTCFVTHISYPRSQIAKVLVIFLSIMTLIAIICSLKDAYVVSRSALI